MEEVRAEGQLAALQARLRLEAGERAAERSITLRCARSLAALSGERTLTAHTPRLPPEGQRLQSVDAAHAVSLLTACLLPFIDSRDGEARQRAAAEAEAARAAEEAGRAMGGGAMMQARPRGTGAKVARVDQR